MQGFLIVLFNKIKKMIICTGLDYKKTGYNDGEKLLYSSQMIFGMLLYVVMETILSSGSRI